MVSKMKIYLDLIALTNFLFDFIMLLATSLILKRNAKFYRVILGALFGSITILMLFIRMNSIQLFIFKFIVSIFMVLITFNYKNIRYTIKNIYYLYLVSIVLGGFLYFLNLQLFSKNDGFLFISNDFHLNILISIILSIIFIYNYVKQIKKLKSSYNKYYKINIHFDNGLNYNLNGFLDTGNKLKDPYKNRPIVLINEKKIKDINFDKFLLVPYHTVSGNGVLKCMRVNKMYIDGMLCKKKFLLGLTDNITIDGVDCILNQEILEG